MKISPEFIEGIKELLRTALIAAVPLLIVQIQAGQFDWKPVAVAGAVAFLSGVDKWLHKKDVGVAGNGLTGF